MSTTPALSRILAPFAKRYIAGTDKQDAINAARSLNSSGINAAIDNLGENVTTPEEAAASAGEYLGLLDLIASTGVRANVSLKLTHMGLDISEKLAFENAGAVVKKAHAHKNRIRFDMEGSRYTQKTIDIFFKLHKTFPNAGIAIQSALLRSAEDVKRLIAEGASVRLVKGAYKEPPEVAFQDKKDVDANFEKLMRELLLKGNMPAIATHDERLINVAKEFAETSGIGKGRFEFEFLLGIKRDLQKRLASEGWNVRVYCPYGSDWLPYTLRRLRERKENVWFVLRNLLD
ncbi:MAG: proline dehydrogenase family protein [Deltaproteobacteria bacterium]|nr:proline dehydrogenase family protein [Deltaproteobacteria bacterium]